MAGVEDTQEALILNVLVQNKKEARIWTFTS